MSQKMQNFVIYLQSLINEFKVQKQKAMDPLGEVCRSNRNSMTRRQTGIQLNPKLAQNENEFAPCKNSKTFQQKIMMQN